MTPITPEERLEQIAHRLCPHCDKTFAADILRLAAEMRDLKIAIRKLAQDADI